MASLEIPRTPERTALIFKDFGIREELDTILEQNNLNTAKTKQAILSALLPLLTGNGSGLSTIRLDEGHTIEIKVEKGEITEVKNVSAIVSD